MIKILFVIPKGETLEEIKERKKIIKDFYAVWNAANPTKQIYNANLKEFINVRFLFIQEGYSVNAPKTVEIKQPCRQFFDLPCIDFLFKVIFSYYFSLFLLFSGFLGIRFLVNLLINRYFLDIMLPVCFVLFPPLVSF